MDSKIALPRWNSSQCMQESRSHVGLPCNVFRRRALDIQESRSRSGRPHPPANSIEMIVFTG
eukprot:1724390-Pyramimonas_sp.AAC.1